MTEQITVVDPASDLGSERVDVPAGVSDGKFWIKGRDGKDVVLNPGDPVQKGLIEQIKAAITRIMVTVYAEEGPQ